MSTILLLAHGSKGIPFDFAQDTVVEVLSLSSYNFDAFQDCDTHSSMRSQGAALSEAEQAPCSAWTIL
jgi:hypothetical protein